MFLTSYKYSDEAGWEFSPIKFHHVNLFVGATGSGKSRLLNTISNVADFVYRNNGFKTGQWDMEFRVGMDEYQWTYHGVPGTLQIAYERLRKKVGDDWSEVSNEKPMANSRTRTNLFPNCLETRPGYFY